MMTRCVAAGVGLREIESHLNFRALKVTRRPGHAKDWRTEAAENILASNTESGNVLSNQV
jgi:phosphoribosyl-ATP pyrophosphohydrolase/phosphoribosyl-AMP cyclohydrolase/histidinol dehydrogenase